MSPSLAKAAFLLSLVAMAVIRAPHVRRSTRIKVVTSRRSPLDNLLVALVALGFVLPLLWITTPVLAFADYPLRPASFAGGAVCLLIGFSLLHQSHADLGTNWSNTLEVRERHELITGGVYRRIRHPMYLALFLHGVGQTLVLPNWLAGPSFLVPFALLIASRVGSEERMMVAEFGKDYEAYMARSKRLVPGVW